MQFWFFVILFYSHAATVNARARSTKTVNINLQFPPGEAYHRPHDNKRGNNDIRRSTPRRSSDMAVNWPKMYDEARVLVQQSAWYNSTSNSTIARALGLHHLVALANIVLSDTEIGRVSRMLAYKLLVAILDHAENQRNPATRNPPREEDEWAKQFMRLLRSLKPASKAPMPPPKNPNYASQPNPLPPPPSAPFAPEEPASGGENENDQQPEQARKKWSFWNWACGGNDNDQPQQPEQGRKKKRVM